MFNIVPLAGVVEELDADIVSLDAAADRARTRRATHEVPAARAVGE